MATRPRSHVRRAARALVAAGAALVARHSAHVVHGGEDAEWIRRRFTEACAEMGTRITQRDGRLIALEAPSGPQPAGSTRP